MGRRVNFLLSIILGVALILRLKGLFHPLLDDQGWRQADTASMALHMLGHLGNFPDVLFPMLNYDGIGPQHVELEMPILPYLLACTWQLFGWADHWGRLWAIFFSLLTIAGVYEFGRRAYSPKVGLIAAACYAVMPLTIYYGRVVMPEPVAQAFSIWSLNAMLYWRSEPTFKRLGLAAVVMAGAILAKLPQLMIFPVAFCIGFLPFKGKNMKLMLIYCLVALSIPMLYYLGANQVSGQEGQFVSGIITNQVVEGTQYYTEALVKNISVGIGINALLLAVIGLIRAYVVQDKDQAIFLGLLLWSLINLLYVLIICQRIALDYYLVPVALLVALLVGIALGGLGNVSGGIISILLAISLLANFDDYYQPKYHWDERILTQGQWLRDNTEEDAVLILSDAPPMTLYYAQRCGYRLLRSEVDQAWELLQRYEGDYFVQLPSSSQDPAFWEKVKKHYQEVGPGVYRLKSL